MARVLLPSVAAVLLACCTRIKVAPKVVDTCDLLANLRSFDGKQVAVRGISHQGLVLRCQVTGDQMTVFLIGDPKPHPGWDELDELEVAQAKSGQKAEIWVTAIGILETNKEGSTKGRGFGHLGSQPAQIKIEDMVDPVVNSTPTYDYSDVLKPRAL
jgi:hypothetical protein